MYILHTCICSCRYRKSYVCLCMTIQYVTCSVIIMAYVLVYIIIINYIIMKLFRYIYRPELLYDQRTFYCVSVGSNFGGSLNWYTVLYPTWMAHLVIRVYDFKAEISTYSTLNILKIYLVIFTYWYTITICYNYIILCCVATIASGECLL